MDKHIEPSRFKEKLTLEEREHLASCRFCREAFADYVEQNELLTAPKDLKMLVMEQSRRPDIQLIAGTNHASRKLQMFFFSLKVGAAVLCALTMLTAVPDFNRQLQTKAAKIEYSTTLSDGKEWSYYEKISNLTEQLTRLPNPNREVNNYDKKER